MHLLYQLHVLLYFYLHEMNTTDINTERKEFWKQVYIGVASSNDCKDKTVPAYWADQALKDFNARFLITQEDVKELVS